MANHLTDMNTRSEQEAVVMTEDELEAASGVSYWRRKKGGGKGGRG